MSAQAKPNAPMSADAGYERIYQVAFVPTFFDKLASRNWTPANEAEALDFLRMGERLLARQQEEGVKKASARGSLISEAASRLDQLLGGPATDARADQYAKSAADRFLAADPLLVDAAVALQESAAAQLLRANAR